MRRTWAVYDVYEGYPVLLQRFTSKADAARLIAEKSPQVRVSLSMVEQLMPDGPRLVAKEQGPNDRRTPPEPSAG
jgi:hypothetical protein